MPTEYSCSIAQTHNERAEEFANQLDKETGYEWQNDPLKSDLWAIEKFNADIAEAYSKMIHANASVGSFHIADKQMLKEVNQSFEELTKQWKELQRKVIKHSFNLQVTLHNRNNEAETKRREIQELKKKAYLC